MTSAAEITRYIKAEALRLGFSVCGIAEATPVAQETAEAFEHWIATGKHGTMSYLERNRDKRFDPTNLLPGCRSIICVAMNYYPAHAKDKKQQLHIARYAQGSDYHKVVKDRLYMLLKSINNVCETKGRPFCDTAPILERYWATRAGIGWIGKNRQLIVPRAGTHFFLGELLLDINLEYDTPIEGNRCGKCSACIENCPTGALSAGDFDARKCLSYLTIEYRGELPDSIGAKMGDCFYGCDRCQICCPHNNFATATTIEDFKASEDLLAMTDDNWKNLTEEQYNTLFKESAVERCGYEQLKRNIKSIANR